MFEVKLVCIWQMQSGIAMHSFFCSCCCGSWLHHTGKTISGCIPKCLRRSLLPTISNYVSIYDGISWRISLVSCYSRNDEKLWLVWLTKHNRQASAPLSQELEVGTRDFFILGSFFLPLVGQEILLVCSLRVKNMFVFPASSFFLS